MGCDTCWLSCFTLVCLWCGRTGRRSVGVRSRDYQIFSDGYFTTFSYLWCSAARASRARAPLKRKSLKSGFGFLNRNLPWGRISRRWNPFSDFAFDSGFPNRTQPYIADLSHVTSYENVPLASRGLLWAWDCVGIVFPDNSFWDLIGDTRLSLCFKTRVQSYWYENDFLYVMRRKLIFQLTNVLHLASLWKWDFFGTRKWPFFRKSLNKNVQDHLLRARETEHPTQTLVFAKTAGHHNLVEVILFSQWWPQGNLPLCLFINYFHMHGIRQNLKGKVLKSIITWPTLRNKRYTS